MATGGEITQGINMLYDTITQIIEDARASVYRTANFTMVKAYWHIGKAIVEEEQNGKERAEYGTELIKQPPSRWICNPPIMSFRIFNPKRDNSNNTST